MSLIKRSFDEYFDSIVPESHINVNILFDSNQNASFYNDDDDDNDGDDDNHETPSDMDTTLSTSSFSSDDSSEASVESPPLISEYASTGAFTFYQNSLDYEVKIARAYSV
jgi:hypothetical protein